MTSKTVSLCDAKWRGVALLALALALGPVSQAFAADEPDLIFRRSTVFKWVSPNDKLATYGVDDPEVEDRKSTRLNSSHTVISYAVFCLKQKLEELCCTS